MTRRRATCLAVLCAMVASMLGVLAVPAAAAPAPTPPPPGPVSGSGNFEGTEQILDEHLIDTTCFFRNTHTIFALQGAGTFAGTTPGGQPVAYTTAIGANQALYSDGPVQVQVESTATYYHGPNGTFGTDPSDCTAAHVGGAVPAVMRIFAPDHLYALDSGSNQVPCGGTGSFYRYGSAWHADWSLDADCTVVGNSAGTPGTGTALKGTLFTDDGEHDPCSDVCTSNIRFDAKQYLAIAGFGVTLVGSTASAQVGDQVTATARVTNDGVAQSGVTVNFSATGPGALTPPSGSALTGSDGRATFAFGASAVGNYSVTAQATSPTDPSHTASANLAVAFTPPDPPTIVVSGPTSGYTEENTSFTATFTDARVPVAGSTINFSVTGAGAATPSTGSAVTDASGKASFAFAGARAGSYTISASTNYNSATVTGTHDVALTIVTFYRAGGVTANSGENSFSAAVIDSAGAYGYFGTNTSPAQVVKVDLSTMARVGAITLASGENSLTSAVIDPGGHFAYFGTNTNPAKVVKVDLGTFTRVGAITLAGGEGSLKSAVIDPAGHYAYVGTGVSGATGQVVKVDLTTFTRVGAITFAADETALQAAVMAPGGAFAYFAARGTSNTGPGRLVKVDLATFTRVGAVGLLGTVENNPASAVIDPGGHFAYLGTNAFPSEVIKIDLGAFARVGALGIDGYDDGSGFLDSADLLSAVMAPDGAHAYFGTTPSSSSTPRQVIEVDLGTFGRARTVSLPAGEGNLASAVVAPDGSDAYFGTSDSPGHVDKIALRRPPNPQLVAGADSYTTPYAVPLTVAGPGVLANDADTADADPLVAGQASDPAGGSVALNPDGGFTYTPDVGFAGTDTFTYTASDGQDYSAPATVSVSVGMAPDQVSDDFGGALGFYTNVGLFGGPIAPRGPAPVVSLPRVGGDLSATDPDGDTGVYGPAFIFENHGPLNVHSQGTTGPGGSVTSSADVYNVEDNDPFHAGSPDGQVSSTCTATQDGVSGSSHIVNGSLVVHTDVNTGDPTEVVTFDHDYDPAPNTEYNGALDHVGDRWRIVLNEQILGPDSITVNALHMYLLGPTARGEMIIAQSRCGVRAAAPNAAPVAGADSYTVTQGQGPLVVEGNGVLVNDTDADGQPLSAAKLVGVFPPTDTADWTFPSDPAHGTLALNAIGSFTYTPDPGYTGPDGFTYVVYDSRGKSDLGHVAIVVNSPPVATDDTYGTTANQPLTVAAPGVLGNDTDADGGTLSAAPLDNPTHGSVTLNPDGSFTYTPVASFVGTDSFTYVLSDGQGGTALGHVTIPVAAANHAPVATGDSYTTNEDTPLTINAPGVLANDTDADANPLTAAAPTTPAHGTLSLNPNGSFTYTPAPNYNGTDSFGYTVSDGQGGTATATVNLTIISVNDPPVAGADAYTTNEDTPLSVAAPGVLANDTDIDSPTLTAGSASTPAHGSVALNADGSFTYAPAPNYNGTDSFAYVVSDGQGGTATAAVSITVTSVPDPPIAGADSYSTYSGAAPLSVAAPGVLANDTDGDGDPLTASNASTPAHGTVALNADGSFTYSPAAGFTGTDTFTYTVSDGTGRTGTGTVTITVHPGQASLLKDLNPGSGSSYPSNYVQMANAMYFLAADVGNWTVGGLWRTDGTQAGTVLLKSLDVSEGNETLTLMGDHLFFNADEGIHGTELWKSDGTAAGTVMVKDINPGPAGSFPNDFETTAIGGTLFFPANDGVHGSELWKSDGTEAGTVLVKDINPGPADGYVFQFTIVGSNLQFLAWDGTGSKTPYQTWWSDGTAAGTVKGTAPPAPQSITLGSSLLFISNSQLWKTGGGDTVLVKDMGPTWNPNSFVVVGNKVFFVAATTLGSALWTTDGTTAGTVLVKEFIPTSTSGPVTPSGLFAFGNKLLFNGSDGTHGYEPWISDGTGAGTVMIKDINPRTGQPYFYATSNPGGFTAVGNTVVFLATDGISPAGPHGQELWTTDGTTAGTVLLKDINPGQGSSAIQNQVMFDGRLYFTADNGTHGRELWETDGTVGGTVLVQDIDPGPASGADYAVLTPGLGTLFLFADDGIHGTEPWRLTPAPTNPALVAADDAYSATQDTPLTVSAPGVLGNDTGAGNLRAIKVADAAHGSVAVNNRDPAHGSVTLNGDGSFTYTPAPNYSGPDSFTYWDSDGTSVSNLATVNLTVVPSRASLLKDTNPGAARSLPGPVVQLGNAGYFLSDFSTPIGLWRTDGTPSGTVLVKSFVNVDNIDELKVMGNNLFFEGNDGVNGAELWKSDGTTAGTTMVKDINPGSDGSYAYNLGVVGGTLYFDAGDATHGFELWKSDGTNAGTTLVKDISPGSGDSDPADFTAVGGVVIFDANDGTHGIELWKTDGTAAGTTLVKDINPGTTRSNISGVFRFTPLGNALLFEANDGTHGSELWTTDGTTAGTSMLKDINPGSSGSNAGQFTVVGNTVLFSASDGAHGPELWKTDGTAAGTTMLKDINPTPLFGSDPQGFTALGSTVLFSASDGNTTGFHGAELWESDGTAAGTTMVKDINPLLGTGTNPGTADSSPKDLVAFGGNVYFSANDGTDGRELWRSDGSASGTVLVQDIDPGAGDSLSTFGSSYLRPALGTVFFAADDGIHGTEPWRLATPPGVSASPSTVTAGGSVTATWSNIVAPSATDWVGLYSSGSVPDPGLVSWAYTGGSTYGSANLSVPLGSPPGATYELRLFTNNTYTRLATSAPFSVAASATTVSATPASVNPGAPVTATWSGISSPTATDWVGLYPSGSTPDAGLINWAYTGGSSGGSLSLTVPLSASLAGTYELRLFSNNSYGRIATSAPFAVAASAATVAASPSTVNPGASVTATWSAIASPTPTDWIGLYSSATAANPDLLTWAYTNGAPGGSLSLPVPVNAPLASTYELRLFTDNTYVRVATSSPFTVAASTAVVSASPSTVNPGAPVTAAWSAITSPTATDWVGLYPSGSTPDAGLINWAYTGGSASGSLNLAVPANAPLANTYELRLFTNNSYVRLATSAPFTVAASTATVSVGPSSVGAGSPVTVTWSGVASPTSTDWVGIYPSGSTPDPGTVAWAYTGGAGSGTLDLTVPSGSSTGTTYEVRLYSNNSYTRLATSAPFTVT